MATAQRAGAFAQGQAIREERLHNTASPPARRSTVLLLFLLLLVLLSDTLSQPPSLLALLVHFAVSVYGCGYSLRRFVVKEPNISASLAGVFVACVAPVRLSSEI